MNNLWYNLKIKFPTDIYYKIRYFTTINDFKNIITNSIKREILINFIKNFLIEEKRCDDCNKLKRACNLEEDYACHYGHTSSSGCCYKSVCKNGCIYNCNRCDKKHISHTIDGVREPIPCDCGIYIFPSFEWKGLTIQEACRRYCGCPIENIHTSYNLC